MSDQRSRSASPTRDEPKAKKQKTGGFKWKEKKAKDEDKADDRDSGKLERGYRNRSPKRESYRERERSPRQDRESDSYRNDKPRKESDRQRDDREADNDRPKAQDRDTETAKRDDTASKFNLPADGASKKDKKPKKPKTPVSTEPMIIVNINDRLGTKAAIPCLASDSIKAFKAVVAAHIGRQPHEIMLKRQGERPFKDALSLQDYGVSNGVQLDLELDTGD